MANNLDIISKMLLDDKQFSDKLEKVKRNTKDYKKDTEELGKSLAGGVAKAFGTVAAAVGVAGGALETFDRLIKSSQTTSDAWDAAIRTAKNSVDSFFNALATGDFSAMTMGLTAMRDKALAAAAAMDALGNAQMSFNYFNSANQADFAEAIQGMREGDSKAKATAEAILGNQQEITNELRKKVEDAVQELMTETNRLSSGDVSILDLNRLMRLDISASGGSEKERLANEYKTYLKELEAIRERNSTLESGKYVNGNYIPGRVTQTDEQKRQMQIEQDALTKTYKDAILYNEVLVKKSDEWLHELISIVTTADMADRTLAQMQKRFSSTSMPTSTSSAETILAPYSGPQAQASGIKGATGVTAATWIETPAILEHSNTQLEETAGLAGDATQGIEALSSAMSSLGGVLGDSASNWVQWAANVMRAIAQAVPAFQALSAAERSRATSSAAAAVSGGASSVASIPYVGPALAVAAAASIAAAIASAPKFATGGVVPGSSLSGDNVLARVNSQEMVLTRDQQEILSDRLTGVGGGKVEFVIRGNQLYGVLEQYNRNQSRNV